jgi:hypothetical protein
LTANHISALLEEGVPYLVLGATLLFPNFLPFPRDVEQDGKGEWLEVVEETEPSAFQLQADQGGDVDVVTKSTVGVSEGPILAIHKAGVGGTPLSSLLVCPIRTGGDEGGRGAATNP